jgi:hypothetical protein
MYLYITLGLAALLSNLHAQLADPASHVPHNYPASTTWLVETDSRLTISGKSNFGGINCDNEKVKQADTIMICRTPVGDSFACKGRFYLNVVDFSCHNYFYTYNLRKTLKMEEHPHMSVRLVRLDRPLPLQEGAFCRANSVVEITLAGVSRQFEVPVEFSLQTNGESWLKGARMFRLQDFNLKSPVKFGGLVKVKNEFVVQFQLSMKRIS